MNHGIHLFQYTIIPRTYLYHPTPQTSTYEYKYGNMIGPITFKNRKRGMRERYDGSRKSFPKGGTSRGTFSVSRRILPRSRQNFGSTVAADILSQIPRPTRLSGDVWTLSSHILTEADRLWKIIRLNQYFHPKAIAIKTKIERDKDINVCLKYRN